MQIVIQGDFVLELPELLINEFHVRETHLSDSFICMPSIATSFHPAFAALFFTHYACFLQVPSTAIYIIEDGQTRPFA
jgi:hypothetical protein